MSKGSLTVACGLALLVPACSYGATVVDIYDGLGSDFAPLDTFFTGFGYTVNEITSSFTASSIAGANFVIISEPTFTPSAAQISALDAYVTGGGNLLLNSEWYPGFSTEITNTNLILTGLGSSIVNLETSPNGGYHDTSDIVAGPFTAGVTDVNYADTSSLSVGAGSTALVYGNPVTDDGQLFIAYQPIGAGDLFVIADSDTADNITSTTTNNNGILYCNFGGLSCAAVSTVPEPSGLLLLGGGLIGIAALKWRRAVSRAH